MVSLMMAGWHRLRVVVVVLLLLLLLDPASIHDEHDLFVLLLGRFTKHRIGVFLVVCAPATADRVVVVRGELIHDFFLQLRVGGVLQ